MNFLKLKIKHHKLAILIAFICGLIYLAPNLFFDLNQQNRFLGIQLTTLDSEPHYMARVRDVAEGHFRHSNVFLFEYKNIDQPIFQYSEQFYGVLLGFLHIDIADFYLFSKFIFSALNFFLWYYFSWLILKSRRAALLSASLLFFGIFIVNNLDLREQLSILFWNTDSSPLLTYGRFVNPLLTFSFFFAGLIQLYRFYDKPNLKNGLFYSFIWGVNFYVYFYFWAFLSVVSGLVFLYFLCTKNFSAFKKSIIVSLGALLIAFYYLWQMLAVAYGGVVEDSTADSMTIFTATHKMIFSKLVFAIFILVLLLFFYKKYKKERFNKGHVFLFLLFLSAIIVVNQQVVTGRLVEEGHFHWYTNRGVVYLGLAMILSYVISKIKNLKFQNIIYGVLFVYLVMFGIGVQMSGYKMGLEKYIYFQNYASSIKWLNKNSKAESVVLANDDLSDLLPAYTHNNVYYAPHAIFYPSNPRERREQAVNVYYFLEKHNEKKIDISYLCKLNFYYNEFQYKYIRKEDRCTDSIKKKLVDNYQEFLKNDFESQLKKYRIDYIVWDKNKNLDWNIDKLDFIEAVFRDGNTVIFEIK